MKPLPKSLNILGMKWKILFKKELGAVGDDEVVEGETRVQDQEIWILEGMIRDRQWIILHHEILHVLDYYTQGDFVDDDAIHRFIRRIDNPLMVFLRDTFKVGK